MQAVPEQLLFETFCILLENIQNSRGKRKVQIVRDFIQQWRKKAFDRMHGLSNTVLSEEDSFFPAMRLLMPALDKDRGAYGLKENKLAQKFIDVLKLPKHSTDAQRLLNYNAPHNVSVGVNDFGSMACSALGSRLESRKAKLTIKDLNNFFDSLVLANADHNQTEINHLLGGIIGHLTAKELKWFCRILLKQVKLGISETSVFGAFHPDASQLFDVTSSLQKVCLQLFDPATKLDEIQVQLFSTFRPMLADRAELMNVPELMNHRTFYIEVKYDGERVQMHKKGSEYRYFSRNGNDFTQSYGKGPGEGSLTPYIHNVFDVSIDSCILDGEMVGWYKAANCIASKGGSFDVKSLTDVGDICAMFVAFDCLMINGRVLSTRPLSERLVELEKVFKPVTGRFMLAERLEGTCKEDIVDALNKAIERREEGIIIKDPTSTYKLNLRTKSGWIKIKPDYIDALSDDLDLLIVGGYYGEGYRRGQLSHFLLALLEPPDESGGEPSRFTTVCKAGSGYSFKELNEMNSLLKLLPKEKFNNKNLPPWINCARERPDVWIDYKTSKVLQIRAAQITPSDGYGIGYTLRFPRVEKIRNDKNWYEATSTEEFHQIRGLAGKALSHDDLEASPTKKKRGGGGPRMRAERARLGLNFAAADLRDVEKLSDVFRDKELCIISGNANFSKQVLERKIVELGGTVTQHPDEGTFCVIAAKNIVRVQNIIKRAFVNVLKPEWLIRCIESEKFVPWVPNDFWYATDQTKATFANLFDSYGDSYTEPVTSEQLATIIKGVSPAEVSQEDIAQLEEEFGEPWTYGLFRLCRVYVDDCARLADRESVIRGNALQLPALLLRLHGGLLTQSLDECTHVLVHSNDLSRLEDIHAINRMRVQKFHVVTEQWLRVCIEQGRLVDATKYQPKLINC